MPALLITFVPPFGRVAGRMVKDLEPGDVTLWLGGYRHTVVANEPGSRGKVVVTFQPAIGPPFTRVFINSKVVGYQPPAGPKQKGA